MLLDFLISPVFLYDTGIQHLGHYAMQKGDSIGNVAATCTALGVAAG